MHNLLLITGTARKDNYSQHVAQFIAEQISLHPDIKLQRLDPVSAGIRLEDEGQVGAFPQVSAQIESADAFVIVTPEYNQGYPGSLKMLLDLQFKEYRHKPVALVGVSSGPWGGARVIVALLPVLRKLGLVATTTDVQFTTIENEVDDAGKLTQPDKWRSRVDAMMSELLWMSAALKKARNLGTDY